MGQELSRQLLDFVDRSPTCYHAVENLIRELHGYERLWESRPWRLAAGGRYFVTRGDSSLIAFRVPRKGFTGFMIAAGHSDSPAFKVRDEEMVSAGECLRLSVEPYGGMVMRSWLDRPLSVAGRVMVREGGRIVSRLVDVDRDLLVIPSVAIHMDREVNKGTALKANVDMLPLFASGKEPGTFRQLIARSAGAAEAELLSTDLFLYPRQRGSLVGAAGEFVASPRLDDLQCVFGCLRGFLAAEDGGSSAPVLAVFNNEEVGSGTRQGADSTFLTDVLERTVEALGMTREEYRQALAGSFLVSADNAHAIHPAHPEYADGREFPVLNGGVVIKYNAGQRYTTDAVSDAVFRQICQEAGVPVQRYSNRADLPGGSTLGNISSAHLSVYSVDIGLPQLAMHAAYEVAGSRDTACLARAMEAYFGRELRVGPEGIALR